MSVKLTRYIFRKIGGRIVPIRQGVDPSKVKDIKNVSKKALDKLNTVLKSRQVRLSKTNKLLSTDRPSSSEMMNKFMKKSGAVRVHHSGDSLSIDNEVTLNAAQQSTLAKMSKGVRDFFTTNKEHFNVGEAIREANKGKPLQKKTKLSDSLTDKAFRRYGETWNPEHTGYVDKKGRMLNFSEDGWSRSLDHRDVSDLVPYRDKPASLKMLNEIYRKEKFSAKVQRAKKHEHWKYINNIKELKSVDFITGKDRGELIKGNIRYIRPDKRHLLKKLKKRRKQ